MLNCNPNAIHLLKANFDYIDWEWLSFNKGAISILEENQNMIDWNMICINPNAISLMEDNRDKLDWNLISDNPSIFTYDYEKIKKDHAWLNRELIEYIYQPRFVERWIRDGHHLEDYHIV